MEETPFGLWFEPLNRGASSLFPVIQPVAGGRCPT